MAAVRYFDRIAADPNEWHDVLAREFDLRYPRG